MLAPAPDILASQVSNVLVAAVADALLFEQYAVLAEEQGFRIIEGGQGGTRDDGTCDYACTDWRTGETLLAGHGTRAEFRRELDAAAGRDSREWVLLSRILDAAVGSRHGSLSIAPSLPESLAEVLADWAASKATVQELVNLTGLDAARIRQMRPRPPASSRP